MTIFRFALLRGLRNWLSIILNLMLPIFLVLLRPLWYEDNGMGPYFLAMLIMYGAFVMARGILNDRLEGTIVRILASPITTFRYLMENFLACLLPLVLQVTVIVLLGIGYHQWEMGHALAMFLLYTVFAMSSIALSFAWSCLIKNKELSFAVFSVMASVVAMLAGFWVPIDLLPNSLRVIGALFPAYWASNGLNALIQSGVQAEYWLSLLAMLMFTAAYLLFGGKRRIV